MNNAITDVTGFQVGHAQDTKGATGCTVILCPPGTVGGVDVRGSAAGTRQIDSLQPFHFVDEVHAVLLSGGSAFGLDAAGGVAQFLEEKSIGYQTSAGKVPIVPTAIIYDLGLGEGRVRPDKKMGFQACVNAQSGPVAEGSVGAGTGASIGKLFGIRNATKGGIGTTSLISPGGVIVGALVVVNAFGDVVEPQNRKILAGARDPQNPDRFIDSAAMIKKGSLYAEMERGVSEYDPGGYCYQREAFQTANHKSGPDGAKRFGANYFSDSFYRGRRPRLCPFGRRDNRRCEYNRFNGRRRHRCGGCQGHPGRRRIRTPSRA